ncbi:carbohydrate kinase family protein [Geotalea daltonii]|nr:carbohydrate kinase family protein [Geotalea daltonii]
MIRITLKKYVTKELTERKMRIAGGFYRENCCLPAWNAAFGSGGRAAAAISRLSPGTVLHTYCEESEDVHIHALKKLGVDVRVNSRPTSIVFAYFHPLSRPHIQPPPDMLTLQHIITISDEAVLRFGFLEGDAIVDADRAVYDPQTWRNPAPFRANGSRANELAIVLNELELKSATGYQAELSLAAHQLIEDQQAELVVVKRGIWGATVYERSGIVTLIPAYRSSRVFKIGTGDVFSAIFAHYWAEKRLSAAEAADLASRAVAQYCNSGQLPIDPAELGQFAPIHCGTAGTVLLLGVAGSLGQRYTMEEARFVLKGLGVEVCCPVLDGELSYSACAALILAEGADAEIIRSIESEPLPGLPMVVLQEKGVRCDELLKVPALEKASIVDDFTTAMYTVTWAALETDS